MQIKFFAPQYIPIRKNPQEMLLMCIFSNVDKSNKMYFQRRRLYNFFSSDFRWTYSGNNSEKHMVFIGGQHVHMYVFCKPYEP